MRLLGAVQVRNEADIVEAFVRHNLTVLDGLVVVDHGSIDATPDILRRLIGEGLPVFLGHETAPEFDQQAMKNRLVRHVFASSDAEWVFPLDADEFVKTPSRATLEAALAARSGMTDASVEWHTYVPRFDSGGDLVARLRSARRVRDEAHGLRKVVVSRAFAARNDLFMTKGHHRVESSSATTPHPRTLLSADVACLAHVPVRSARQFTAKVAVGWLANLRTPVREHNESIHVREAYEYVRSGRPLTPRQLEAFAMNYSTPMERWLPTDAIEVEEAPFLADIELAYRREAEIEPLALVLQTAEQLIQSHPGSSR